ncbi:MAG: hypothetical protein J1D87_11935 [Lachnospiraceae bacterium]|nr:hypothetical protein [Lachnospiraceae bacterium]
MDAFMSALIKMSLRGIVIILVVFLVRFLLKKLRISHKYILGLWAMAFLFFIFPWKLSLSIGFWNNANIPEEVRVIAENLSGAGHTVAADDAVNVVNPSGGAENITGGMPAVPTGDIIVEPVVTKPVEPAEQSMQGINEVKKHSLNQKQIGIMLCLFWLVGLSGFIGHMLYSYYTIKRKLQVSVLYQENIWWIEDVDIPMVFGFISPRIYLPVSIEPENLTYVIAHEKMHIKRKDGLFKMTTYIICLIHWFNPFIWIAYFLFGSDMEKACDEEVIRSMGKEKRKEYAYALLHIAAENGRRKKKVFVAPICFDEGNVKSRIKNVMKYKYTLPGIGAVVVILILSLSALFLTEAKAAGQESPEQKVAKTDESGEGTLDGSDKAIKNTPSESNNNTPDLLPSESANTESLETTLTELSEGAQASSSQIDDEPVSVMQAFRSVLLNEAAFSCTDKVPKRNVNVIREYNGFLNEMSQSYAYSEQVCRFAVVDMDGDYIPEVLLELDDYVGYIILRYVDGQIQGNVFGYRSMSSIRENGTFQSAGSAFEGWLQKLYFISDTVVMDWKVYSLIGQYSNLYCIDDISVGKEDYERAKALYKGYPKVEWHDYMEEEVNKYIVENPLFTEVSEEVVEKARERQAYLDSLSYLIDLTYDYSQKTEEEFLADGKNYYDGCFYEMKKIYQLCSERLTGEALEALDAEQQRWEKENGKEPEQDELYYEYGDKAFRRVLRLINVYYGYEFYNWTDLDSRTVDSETA